MAETWIEIKDIQKLFDAIVDEELDIIEIKIATAMKVKKRCRKWNIM